MLTLDIEKSLGALQLKVQLELPPKGISAIFGRSGAGKTSLVNIISGLIRPDRGRLVLGERVVVDTDRGVFLPPEQRRIGYVFQDARLFPHYTVRGNLDYGRRRKDPRQFEHVIELLGIGPLLGRYPATLSGGEKQRVAIGRALLSDPGMLLMDEPLASLDLPRKRELLPYLERLAGEVELPILYVTHSLEEILHLADHMVLLHQGQVLRAGCVDEVWDSPQMRPWLPAEAQSTLLSATVCGHHSDYAMSCLQLAGGEQLWVRQIKANNGDRVRVRIHASDVSIVRQQPTQTSIRNILPATVVRLEEDRDNEQVEVLLQLGQTHLWANITLWAADELALSPGETVFAQVKGISLTQADWAPAH